MSHYTMIYKNGDCTSDFLGLFISYRSLVFYIPPVLVGYEMIIANSALRASLAIYHPISNERSWNNC